MLAKLLERHCTNEDKQQKRWVQRWQKTQKLCRHDLTVNTYQLWQMLMALGHLPDVFAHQFLRFSFTSFWFQLFVSWPALRSLLGTWKYTINWLIELHCQIWFMSATRPLHTDLYTYKCSYKNSGSDQIWCTVQNAESNLVLSMEQIFCTAAQLHTEHIRLFRVVCRSQSTDAAKFNRWTIHGLWILWTTVTTSTSTCCKHADYDAYNAAEQNFLFSICAPDAWKSLSNFLQCLWSDLHHYWTI